MMLNNNQMKGFYMNLRKLTALNLVFLSSCALNAMEEPTTQSTAPLALCMIEVLQLIKKNESNIENHSPEYKTIACRYTNLIKEHDFGPIIEIPTTDKRYKIPLFNQCIRSENPKTVGILFNVISALDPENDPLIEKYYQRAALYRESGNDFGALLSEMSAIIREGNKSWVLRAREDYDPLIEERVQLPLGESKIFPTRDDGIFIKTSFTALADNNQ